MYPAYKKVNSLGLGGYTMITQNKYIRRLAYLEAVYKQLSQEINNLNELLKSIGFKEGLKSLKQVAEEIIEDELDRNIEDK